tara:strand:- start:2009 stop:2254 length:246 start_codon:yes stop_codon:yes gene_type:complete
MAERFIIIGRSSCPFCAMAQDILRAKQIESIFLDYEEERDILEDYKQFHNQDTVPIILSNNLDSGYVKKIGGYTDLLDHLN